MFEKEINSVVKGVLKKQPTKTKLKVSSNAIPRNKLVQNIFSGRMMCNKNNSCKTLSFWLSKITYYSICALNMIEIFYNAFMLFKNCVSFKNIVLRISVYVRSQKYVKPIKLVEYCFTTTSFDLWMSKNTHSIFALVINFSKVHWQPKHITMSLFEVNRITRQVLAINLIFSFFPLIILIILFFWITKKSVNLIIIIFFDNWVVIITLKTYRLTNLWEPTMWELDRGSFPTFLKFLVRSMKKFY